VKLRMNITKLMIVAGITISLLGFAPQASAISLTLADAGRYIGNVQPGTPTSPPDEVSYINQLISMGANATTTISGNTFDRANSICSSAGLSCPWPAASITGGLTDLEAATTNLGSGYTYLYVKYSAGAGSDVWDIRGLTGTIGATGSGATHTFPLVAGEQNNQVSHYALFNPGTTTVPEPSSLLLLGSGMVAIALRRWMRK